MPKAVDNRFTMYEAWKPDRQIFIRNLTMVHMMHRDDVDALLKHPWLKQMMTAFIFDFMDKIDGYGDPVKYDDSGWNTQFTRYIYNRYRASKTFSDTVPQDQRKQYSYDPQHENVRNLMGEKAAEPSSIARKAIPGSVDSDAFMRWIEHQQEKTGQTVGNSYFNECLSLFSHIPKDEQSFRVSNCIVGGYNKPWVKMNESAQQAKRKYLGDDNKPPKKPRKQNQHLTAEQASAPENSWQPGSALATTDSQASAIPAMTFAGQDHGVSSENIDMQAFQRWIKHRQRNKYAVVDEQAIAEQFCKIPKSQQAEAVSYSIAGDYKQVFPAPAQTTGRHSAKSQGGGERYSFMALARGDHLKDLPAESLDKTQQLAQQFDKLRLQKKEDEHE